MKDSNLEGKGKNENKNKFNLSSFLILVLIILLLLVSVLYFVNNLKNIDSDIKNDTGKSENNNNSEQDENALVKDDFVLPANYVPKNAIEPVNTTRVIVGDSVYEINSNKELVKMPNCASCASSQVDLNGESAKYVSAYQSSDSIYHIITLTEKGNLYETLYDNEVYSNTVVSRKILNDLSAFALYNFSVPRGHLVPEKNIVVGFTNDNKYVYRYNNTIINENNIVSNVVSIYNGETNGSVDQIIVYDNGRLKFVGRTLLADSYKKCIGENVVNNVLDEKCTKELFNMKSYIVDENSNLIHARAIISRYGYPTYIISLDNRIYELTNDKSGENYIAKNHSDLTVKSFDRSSIIYNNDSVENLDFVQYSSFDVLFEEK